ncbi:MAG: cupin domain-containing protein [Candidatus Limnocylindria bacterium]
MISTVPGWRSGRESVRRRRHDDRCCYASGHAAEREGQRNGHRYRRRSIRPPTGRRPRHRYGQLPNVSESIGRCTAGAFSLLEAEEPPHFGPPMHIHHDAAEAFYVLSGEYVIFIDGDKHIGPAGSFIHIPAGVPHGFRVGTAPSRKLNIYVPAAMVGYFEELSAAIARDEMDDDTLGEIARRYGMEVIGPVPEGYV